MPRPAALTRFIRGFRDAATTTRHPAGAPSLGAAQRMCAALDRAAGQPGDISPLTLPVCRYFDPALGHARAGSPALAEMAAALRELAPLLHWRRKTGPGCSDAPFVDGHANTQLVGPDGLEQRSDVVLGASLLAPHVRYPDHDHPPGEIYVVMSEGDWFTQAAGWYTPGLGGIVHHRPGILHAMRSGPGPLLAVWCLWAGD